MPEVYRRKILEIVVPGKPLGRHVFHDPRSLQYQVHADGTVASAKWDRMVPVFDQGNLGSCTGNATVGVLATAPFYATLADKIKAGLELNEDEAKAVYSAAEIIDGGKGLPTEDEGSSGLSAAKAALKAGLISGYQHMTSVAACQTAIQRGPFIVGSDWLTGMDSPDPSGLVVATGTVRGGHEYECDEYDAQTDLWGFWNSWGTSYGVGGKFYYNSSTLGKLLAADGDATAFVPLSQPAPVPTPVPTPTDIDSALWAASAKWAAARHVGANKNEAKLLTLWAQSKGYV